MQFKELNKEWFGKIASNTSILRITYIISLFLGMLAFGEVVSIVVNTFVLLWSIFVLKNNFIKSRDIFKIKYHKILFAFLISCVCTSIINYQTNWFYNAFNIVMVYHSAVCFFLMYGLSAEKDEKSIQKEMIFIFKFITISTTILTCLGFLVFAIKMQVNVGKYSLGIYNNRFIGLYENSNLAAFSCCLSIIFSHMLVSKSILVGPCQNKMKKYFYIFSIIINLCALLLTDSNASFLFLIVYTLVFIFYKLFSQKQDFSIWDILKRIVVLLLCCITLSFSLFTLREVFQENIAIFINDIHKDGVIAQYHQSESDNTIVDNQVVEDQVAEDNQENPITIGRNPLSGNYDVSSGRITLLKQAIIIFKNHPIMGAGRGSLYEYANKEIEGGLKFPDFHNGYMTILVSWGIVGFLIFILFALLVAISMCQKLFPKVITNKSNIYACLFSMIVSYSIYSLFEKTILTEITFMVVIFWLLLGYAVSYANINNKDLKETDQL